MGFGFEAVAVRNPRIVFCSSSGFGREGEMAGLPCTDPHIQAFSGFAALNGRTQGGERVRYYGMIDLYTGQLICEAVLAALIARRRRARATIYRDDHAWRRDRPCCSRSSPAICATAAAHHRTRATLRPTDSIRRSTDPIALTVEDDAQFGALCGAIERDDLRRGSAFRHGSGTSCQHASARR